MFLIVLTFLCILVASVRGIEETRAEEDEMGYEDKSKLIQLSLLLLKDAKLKVRQVTSIKDDHSIFISFDVGVVMGKIREKYKRMMEVYREAMARYTSRVGLQSPGLIYFRPLIYIISMELVHMLEVDIDKLIDMIENIPKEWIEGKRPKKVRSVKNATLRAGPSIEMLMEEEEYKSQLREQYTIKKLGINKTVWAWNINSLT